jgi:hypothetical protein
MATRGLSLFGFMTQQVATTYLQTNCIPANPDIQALIVEWQSAKARRGAPMAGGNPDIRNIPAAARPYIEMLMQQQWVAELVASLPGAEFKLVEIDPLLTAQFSVDLERSAEQCAALPQNPSVADLLPVCLPAKFPSEKMNIDRLPAGQPKQLSVGAVLLIASSLNIHIAEAGYSETGNRFTIQFGMAAPLVQVTRFNGRCYLFDGLHRTFGVRQKGASHVPCLFWDVQSAAEVGIKPYGKTFTQELLESADAPTVGHFTQGRACGVQLKRRNRIVQVTWAEYGISDE